MTRAEEGSRMPVWVACPACRLKHSARPDGLCPRCRQPVAPGAGGHAPPDDGREAIEAGLDARALPTTIPPDAPPPPGAAPIVAPPSPDRAPAPRRVWTVFLAYVLVVIASALASTVVVFAAIAARAAREPGLARDGGAARTLSRAVLESPSVQFGSVVATAAVLIAVALAGGRLSSEPLRLRLALGARRVGSVAVVVAAAACAAVSSTFDAAFGALGLEPTGSLAQLGRILSRLSPAGLVVALAVAGIAAPFAEELFFRGYLQTRLCRRWGTWTGIVVTAALFGLLHFDWLHSPSAFVIGLYLGWLAARSGSVVPGMWAHATNNVLWAVATSAGWGAHLARGTHGALLVLYVAGAVAAIAWLRPRLAGASGAAGGVRETTVAPPLDGRVPPGPAANRPSAGGARRYAAVALLAVALVVSAAAVAVGVMRARGVEGRARSPFSVGDVVTTISGSNPSWSLELPDGHWRTLKQHPLRQEITKANEVVAWPERGATIAVTAEPLGGRKLSPDAAMNAVLASASRGAAQFEAVSRTSLGAYLDGSLVHATGLVDSERIEMLYAVFVHPDAVIQVKARCPAESYDEVYEDFRAAVDSLRR